MTSWVPLSSSRSHHAGASPYGLAAGGCPLLASCWRPLLVGALQPATLVGIALQVAVPTGSRLQSGPGSIQSPPCRGPWPQLIAPLQGA
ncbi:hypothetical protein B296_00008039 [Ensete ventricosum]|uniref:Uncharacterized protein n=1 Tax=Ensete ventricosum TaxID=4639 RepID=A0A426ZM73_ENSVE|nr:hypothetical protein B296_00008039 [Ensete ventricosum]